ncbi:MAG: DUF1566 domain-containing protein [Pseudomonadota bacterium]
MTSELLIAVFSGLMLLLALIDLLSFFVFKRHINLKSIIVSMGMLGTFIGIAIGLWEFDTQNIVGSMPILLEGLKLAFITSIVGMGLVIFLSILQAKPKKKEESITYLLLQIKQGLETLNQSIDKRLETVNQTLVTKLDKVEQNTNQSLAAILDTVNQLKTDIYQRRSRFTKLSLEGQVLPEEATQWAAVVDNQTGLIWEIKTNDGGLQDSKHTYNWCKPNGKIVGPKNEEQCQGCRCNTLAYVQAINKISLAGYSDWRIPTLDEFKSLVKDQSGIDKRYFPNIYPAWYYTTTPHPKKNNILYYFSFDNNRLAGGIGRQHMLLTTRPR